MTVRVLELTDMAGNGGGDYRAQATIMVNDLVIHRVRLMKKAVGKPYVLPPQMEHLQGNRLKLSPLMEWPGHWDGPICAALWQVYRTQRDNKTLA